MWLSNEYREKKRRCSDIVHMIIVCAILEMAAMLSGCGSKSADCEKYCGEHVIYRAVKERKPAVLEADEQKITVQGANLFYGNLRIEFPDGVEAEVLQAEACGDFFAEWEDGVVVALPGAEEVYKEREKSLDFNPIDMPLPPKIRLMHYRAEYENETALIDALFLLLPGVEGQRIYADEKESEYGYRMLQEDKCQYFIFVRGKDVYLIQEIRGTGIYWKGLFTVNYLLTDRALYWQDDGAVIGSYPAADDLEYQRVVSYDGMAPKEVYSVYYTLESMSKYVPHEVMGETAESGCVPQEFLDELADTVLLEAEAETINEMRIDRELSKEEMLLLAEKSKDILLEMVNSPHYSDCWVTGEADCDNDGVKDIIAQVYRGGTAGIVYYIFFKGQSDGTYVKTSEFQAFEEDFAVISYRGKNYLCRMPYDYDRSIDNGFTLIDYEDGDRVEEVSLTLFSEQYDVRVVDNVMGNASNDVLEDISGDFVSLAADIAEKCFMIKEQIEGYEIFVGGAEQKVDRKDTKEKYQCDLDNDKKTEFYDKYIWKTHHRLTSQLVFTCVNEEKSGISLLQRKLEESVESGEAMPLMLWVEPCGEINIINVFYRRGQEDFRITGYLITGNNCCEVYEIAADACYEVKQSCRAVYHN